MSIYFAYPNIPAQLSDTKYTYAPWKKEQGSLSSGHLLVAYSVVMGDPLGIYGKKKTVVSG